MSDGNQSVHIGLWLGLGSLFLMGVGILYYDTEEYDEDLNTRMSRSQYFLKATSDDNSLKSWKQTDDDLHKASIFNRILQGQEEGRVLYEDEFIAAISAEPKKTPVHFIVFPKKVVTNLSMMLSIENGDLLVGKMYSLINKLAKDLDLDSGFRVVMNDGIDADQTIQHFHLHVMGGQAMGWPPFPVKTFGSKSQNDYDYDNYDMDNDFDDSILEKMKEMESSDTQKYAQQVLGGDDDVPDDEV